MIWRFGLQTIGDVIAERHGMRDNIIYSSFNHFQIQKAKEVIRNAFIAPLYSYNMLNPWNYCLDIGASATHPKQTQIRLLPDYVKNCHDRGIRVHTWTVNAGIVEELNISNNITE